MAPNTLIEELDCGIEQGSVTGPDLSPDSRTVYGEDVQADVQDVPSSSSGGVMLHQDVLTFQDSTTSNIGDSLGPPAVMTSGDQTASHSLDEFFARPVRIGTFVWNETDGLGTVPP